MHEMSIVMKFVEIATDYSKKNQAKRVRRVVLQIGELTGAEPRYLEMFYPSVVEGTILEQSELVIETIEASVFCTDCGMTYNPCKAGHQCPACGGVSCDVIDGMNMFVKEIVIEEGEYCENLQNH